jgi:DNA-binding transcriptional MerR regulator
MFRRFRKRRRPPRAKAKLRLDGYTAAELGAKVGVSARTIRFYTAQRLLPAPEFRGAATRYLREHLVHLAAIRFLQRERRASLDAIRRQLEPLGAGELEQLAAGLLPELRPPAPAAASQGAQGAHTAPLLVLGDTWQRWTIAPGLEIHLHAGASAEVRVLAERLVRPREST